MPHRDSLVRVVAQRPVHAPASRVYHLIADYRDHHPAFLPTAISDLVVEQGGYGAGTEIAFNVRLGGRKRHVRALVSEPHPGRVIAETDTQTGAVTSFVVADEGDHALVTIQTEFAPAAGLQGWVERRFAPGMLRKLYVEELEKLDEYARRQAA